MITTGDARNILIRACSDLDIREIYTSWGVPEGRIKRERIVVVAPPSQSQGTYWEDCYIRVNICVPDVRSEANMERLDELERIAKAKFKEWTYGVHDGTAYHYRYESIGPEEDKNLGCHYIYIRVLFRVLNVKKD